MHKLLSNTFEKSNHTHSVRVTYMQAQEINHDDIALRDPNCLAKQGPVVYNVMFLRSQE